MGGGPAAICIGKGTYGRVFRTSDGSVYKELRTHHHGELNSMSIRELILTQSAAGASGVMSFDRVVPHKRYWRLHMPYGGQTLIDWVAAASTEDKRLYGPWLMKCLLRACVELQARGIQHLDMSPQNILVDDAPTARLIDLGLASFRRASSESSEWHDAYGTWIYCPPEVVLHLHVMETSVVWCLAMIACYIACGCAPVTEELRPTENISEQKDVAACIQRTWTTTLATSGSSSWVLSYATRERLRSVLPAWERVWGSIAAWRPLRRLRAAELWAVLYPEEPLVLAPTLHTPPPLHTPQPSESDAGPRGPAAFRLFCHRHRVDVAEYNRIARRLEPSQAAEATWCMVALLISQMLMNIYEEGVIDLWLNRWNQRYWAEEEGFVAIEKTVVETRLCEWGMACGWRFLAP